MQPDVWRLALDAQVGKCRSCVHDCQQCFGTDPKEPVAAGKATIRYEFSYEPEGDAPGAGGTGTIFVNGEKMVDGRIGNTTPFLFSADETADVGMDGATPVTEDYAEGDNAFTGKIEKVTVDLT